MGETAAKVARRLSRLVYRPHVGYEFTSVMLRTNRAKHAEVPAGYESRQPPLPGDEAAIAALLSQEPGYGAWTSERVRTELLGNLAHPHAATLVLRDGVPVACAFATDASTRTRKIAHGTYLYVVPAHRGRGKLAAYIVYITLGFVLDAGYDRILGFTDPRRLSALLLYLSEGARPMPDSLSGLWHWHRIRRRLAPALKRAARYRPAAGAGPPRATGAP